ncbi:MAG: aminodeoxychorismate synthase component I [Verrucomicrobiae bacterium]|nr:aminodeoxychorismate synthase component I [Verrucomicrobiae bacterium]
MKLRPLIQELTTAHTPESLGAQLRGSPGLVVLRSAGAPSEASRYSFVTARPFMQFRSTDSRCEIFHTETATEPQLRETRIDNPWQSLGAFWSRYEFQEPHDSPFPLGGCFGYWGYDLKNFTETKLPRRASNDLQLPDSHVGFYASLVVFDHRLGTTWIVATGLGADGNRSETRQREQLEFWSDRLAQPPGPAEAFDATDARREFTSNRTRADFLAAITQAQRYIRAGDIYQVNLSQRLVAPWSASGWELFLRLTAASPAPFAAFIDGGDFQLASSSPEQFLRIHDAEIITQPIKGTRPRGATPAQDERLAHELQSSPKERAELVMITDLLRNDLGRFCAYGSVRVTELARLERFAQVQHLISTVRGRLRPEVTHWQALAAAFPGGSITGAPKFRAMEIIDELEPVARGPYCGCHGYLGFNRQSQLSISIRTAICRNECAYFYVGAGIVADSDPAAEYEETLAKARGFLAALNPSQPHPQPVARA